MWDPFQTRLRANGSQGAVFFEVLMSDLLVCSILEAPVPNAAAASLPHRISANAH